MSQARALIKKYLDKFHPGFRNRLETNPNDAIKFTKSALVPKQYEQKSSSLPAPLLKSIVRVNFNVSPPWRYRSYKNFYLSYSSAANRRIDFSCSSDIIANYITFKSGKKGLNSISDGQNGKRIITDDSSDVIFLSRL